MKPFKIILARLIHHLIYGCIGVISNYFELFLDRDCDFEIDLVDRKEVLSYE